MQTNQNMEDASVAQDGLNSSKKRTHPDDFKRAYKACINCRQRKAKCILEPDELKPPCQRCKREMRECVFRSERSWVKRRKPGEARDAEAAEHDEQEDEQSALGYVQRMSHLKFANHAAWMGSMYVSDCVSIGQACAPLFIRPIPNRIQLLPGNHRYGTDPLCRHTE
jgi:hypothetical protein